MEGGATFKMTTGAFSWNIGKLFSELKLVTDNLLFIYAEANWEATESYKSCKAQLDFFLTAT